jgi:hypothetical protein
MASDIININTNRLGILEVPVSDGLYKKYEFDLGGQQMSVALHIVEDALNAENVNLGG